MSRILLLGDTFGKPGRQAIFERLPSLIETHQLDFVIVNAENIAGGKGLTPEICLELFDVGVDVITTGNHVLDKKEIIPMLESEPRVLRPINFFTKIPGSASVVKTSRSGQSIAVMNAMGKVHFRDVHSPFEMTKAEVIRLREMTPIVIVDFHAEATSEKRAMGWYLDGLVSAVLGTHSHVQTADEEILPKGTAYITDVGMTGPYESVIGMQIDLAIERLLTEKRNRFEVAKGNVKLCGAIVDIDNTTGKAKSIQRLQENYLSK